MADRDWEVGPVLKNKSGSQGTLFRGGTKYSSDARFPRGYTPERQNEVAEAVVRPSVQHYFDRPPETSTGTQSKFFKDRKVRGSGSISDAPLHNESAQPTRDLVDNIARSTVPVEHLSGVQFRTSSTSQTLGPADQVAGHYDRRGDALSKGEPVIRLRDPYEKTSTAIHEIGHHVSHSVEGNKFPRDENRHSGQEEAFADDYAEKHYRDRKGRPEERGIYGGGPYGGHIQRSEEFWDGYGKNRDWTKSREDVARQDEEYYKRYPEARHGDEPLINKEHITSWEIERGDRASIEINPEAMPHGRW